MKIYAAFATALKDGKYYANVFTFNAPDRNTAESIAVEVNTTQIYPPNQGYSQHRSGVTEVTKQQIEAWMA